MGSGASLGGHCGGPSSSSISGKIQLLLPAHPSIHPVRPSAVKGLGMAVPKQIQFQSSDLM